MSDPADDEWLLLRERGEDVSHIPAETRAPYERLARLIEELLDEAPAPGWEERVMAAVKELPDDDPASDGGAAPGEPAAAEEPQDSGASSSDRSEAAGFDTRADRSSVADLPARGEGGS